MRSSVRPQTSRESSMRTTVGFFFLSLLATLVLSSPLASCQSSTSRSISREYGPSDDASWAIYSKTLSSLLAPDKQSIYDKYVEDCNQLALKEQEREGRLLDPQFCSFNEETRLRMNREQPSSVYNYTQMGFAKIKTPPELFQLIREFYNTNRNQSTVEWSNVNTYQNLWDIPSTIVRLEDERLVGGGEGIKDLVWKQAQIVLEEWVGQALTPVSLYGVREYHRGSLLAPHVDRMPLVTSAIINVDQQGMDEPWSLEVYGHDGVATNVTMEPGDMVLYESHSVIHGRPFPLQGDLYANIFLHFEPAMDKSTYDPKVGLPPYIVPGSQWDVHWRAEHPNGWLADQQESKPEQERTAREAVFQGDIDLLRKLGKEDPKSLHQPDTNGWHPLHEAVRAGSIEMVQILLDHGADINQATKYQQNSLSISREAHGLRHAMTKFVMEMGAVDAGPDL